MTSCTSAEDSALLTERSMRAKKGSVKTLTVSSPMTSAMDPARRLAGERAARLRTYPSRVIACSTLSFVCGRTRAEPVSTRDAVADDTPARWATSASVGGPTGFVIGSVTVTAFS
jgi:hypothetical protein